MKRQLVLDLDKERRVQAVEIVLSLQDQAFQLVQSGTKNFEYRRRWRAGRCVAYIYRSGKVKGIAARMFLGEPVYGSAAEIGKIAENDIPGNGGAVEEYFRETGGGYAIPIEKFEEFPIIPLSELRSLGFTPPQYFFYLRAGMLKQSLEERLCNHG